MGAYDDIPAASKGTYDDLPSATPKASAYDDIPSKPEPYVHDQTGVTLRKSDNAVWIPSVQAWVNVDKDRRPWVVDDGGNRVSTLAYRRKSLPADVDVTPAELAAFTRFKGQPSDLDTTTGGEALKLAAGFHGAKDYVRRLNTDLHPHDVAHNLNIGAAEAERGVVGTLAYLEHKATEGANAVLGPVIGGTPLDEGPGILYALNDKLKQAEQQSVQARWNQDPTIVAKATQMAPTIAALEMNPAAGQRLMAAQMSNSLGEDAQAHGAGEGKQALARLFGGALGMAGGKMVKGEGTLPATLQDRLHGAFTGGVTMPSLQVALNAFARTYNPEQKILEGVDDQAVQGALMGGTLAKGRPSPVDGVVRDFSTGGEFSSGANNTARGVGQMLNTLRQNALRNRLVGQGFLEDLKGYSPEARREVLGYMDALVKGDQPQPLGEEAAKLYQDPTFRELLTRNRQVTGEAYPDLKLHDDFLPRVVVEGVESPSLPDGVRTGGIARNAGEWQGRSYKNLKDWSGADRTVHLETENLATDVKSGERFVKVKDAWVPEKSADAYRKLVKAKPMDLEASPDIDRALGVTREAPAEVGGLGQDSLGGRPVVGKSMPDSPRGYEDIYAAPSLRPPVVGGGVPVEPPTRLSGGGAVEPRAGWVQGPEALLEDPLHNQSGEAFAGRSSVVPDELIGAGQRIARKEDPYVNPQTGGPALPPADVHRMTEATTAQIEQDVPGLRYSHDPVANLVRSSYSQANALAGQRFLDNVKASDLVKVPGQTAPPNWVEPKLAGFEGHKVDPRLARVLDAWSAVQEADPTTKGASDAAQNFTNAIVQAGFAVPTVHWWNMASHALKTLGSPTDLPTFVDSLRKAKTSMESMRNGGIDPFAADYLKSGGQLMTGREFSDRFNRSMGEALAGDETAGLNPLLEKDQPQTSAPGKLLDKTVGAMNRKFTWEPDDIIRMALADTYAKKYGLELPDAIREVDRSYPDYRLSLAAITGDGKGGAVDNAADKVNGVMNAVAKSPLFLFQRYRRSAWGGASNLLLDLTGQTNLNDNVSPSMAKLRQKMAMNKLVGTGVSMGTVTALSGLLKGMTGDEDEEKRLGGFEHVAAKTGELGSKMAGGDMMGAGKVAADELTPSPLLSAFLRAKQGGANGRLDVNPNETTDALQAIKRGDMQQYAQSAGTNLKNSARGMASSVNFSVPSILGAFEGRTAPGNVAANLLLGGKSTGTEAENLLRQALSLNSPKAPPLSGDQESSADYLKLKAALKGGDFDAAAEIFRNGRISDQRFTKAVQASVLPREMKLALSAKALKPEDVMRIYEAGTEQERSALLPILMDKVDGVKDEDMAGASRKAELAQRLMKLLGE